MRYEECVSQKRVENHVVIEEGSDYIRVSYKMMLSSESLVPSSSLTSWMVPFFLALCRAISSSVSSCGSVVVLNALSSSVEKPQQTAMATRLLFMTYRSRGTVGSIWHYV